MRPPTIAPAIEHRIVAGLVVCVVILLASLFAMNARANSRNAAWEARADRALITADSLAKRVEVLEAAATELRKAADGWKRKSDSTEARARSKRASVGSRIASIPSVVADSAEPISIIAAKWEAAARDALAVADIALEAKAQSDSAYARLDAAFAVQVIATEVAVQRGDSLAAVLKARPPRKACRFLKVGCKTWAFLGGAAAGAFVRR